MIANTASVYTDFQGIENLKTRARDDQEGTLDEVAQQFESLLMHQMLKTMRQANLSEGIMDSDQTKFYQDMYDQQISVHLAENGGMGLSDLIKSQLGGGRDNIPSIDGGQELKPLSMSDIIQAVKPLKDKVSVETNFDSPEDFIKELRPWAEKAAAEIGLSGDALLAQAALETGWGKGIMKTPSEDSSHNLFGIKADSRWDGAKVKHVTLEFEEGIPSRKNEAFRAYESFKDSFNDYVDFIQSNPRYSTAVDMAADPKAYFNALQEAGYATDPNYAEKLSGIMDGSVMNKAMAALKKG